MSNTLINLDMPASEVAKKFTNTAENLESIGGTVRDNFQKIFTNAIAQGLNVIWAGNRYGELVTELNKSTIDFDKIVTVLAFDIPNSIRGIGSNYLKLDNQPGNCGSSTKLSAIQPAAPKNEGYRYPTVEALNSFSSDQMDPIFTAVKNALEKEYIPALNSLASMWEAASKDAAVRTVNDCITKIDTTLNSFKASMKKYLDLVVADAANADKANMM